MAADKDKVRSLGILEVRPSARVQREDLIARETPVTIFLNDEDLVTLLCTPCDLVPLAVGFLFSEGLIRDAKEIKTSFADRRDRAVWVETKGRKRQSRATISRRLITTGCGKRLSFADMGKGLEKLPRSREPLLGQAVVQPLMRLFQTASRVYTLTGGVHSAALAEGEDLVYFSEDVGRHNAADKAIGKALIDRGGPQGMILVTSGRISSDILAKAVRGRIPVILSKAAPTDLAVSLARRLNVTIVGFARGLRMNVYSGEWRVDARS